MNIWDHNMLVSRIMQINEIGFFENGYCCRTLPLYLDLWTVLKIFFLLRNQIPTVVSDGFRSVSSPLLPSLDSTYTRVKYSTLSIIY